MFICQEILSSGDNELATLCKILQKHTKYNPLGHIGHSKNSYVVLCENNTVVKFTSELDIITNDKIDFSKFKYQIPNEIKFATTVESIEHLAVPKDTLRIITLLERENQVQTKIWVCLVYPQYSKDLESYGIKALTNYQKLLMTSHLLKAVINLHNIEWYHNDIKPTNLVVHNGLLNLIDFGCATKENINMDFKNTFSFFTPMQAYNHLSLNLNSFIKESVYKYMPLLEISIKELYNAVPIENMYIEKSDANDIFCTMIMIVYIFGNHRNFYINTERKGLSYNDEELQFEIYDNVLMYCQNPRSYILTKLRYHRVPYFLHENIIECFIMQSQQSLKDLYIKISQYLENFENIDNNVNSRAGSPILVPPME